MKKLWLVQFKLSRYEYMRGLKSDSEYTFRLVRGKTKEEIENKIKDLFEYGSHGGDSATVIDFDANECIDAYEESEE